MPWQGAARRWRLVVAANACQYFANLPEGCQAQAHMPLSARPIPQPISATVARFWRPPSLPLSLGSFGKCFLKSRPGRIVCL